MMHRNGGKKKSKQEKQVPYKGADVDKPESKDEVYTPVVRHSESKRDDVQLEEYTFEERFLKGVPCPARKQVDLKIQEFFDVS